MAEGITQLRVTDRQNESKKRSTAHSLTLIMDRDLDFRSNDIMALLQAMGGDRSPLPT